MPTNCKGDVPEEIAQHGEQFALLGRKYCVMVEPWIDNIFEKPCPDIDPFSEERFLSDASKLQGRIAELYDFVPQKFHRIMNNHSFFHDTVGFYMLRCV